MRVRISRVAIATREPARGCGEPRWCPDSARHAKSANATGVAPRPWKQACDTLPAMRDTEVLRRRLWATAGLPLATSLWLTACDGGASPKPVTKDAKQTAKADDAKSIDYADGPILAKDDEDADPEPGTAVHHERPAPLGEQTTWVPPFDIEQIPAGEFDYYGPSRDPFGAHEEEDGCPNGDWCGAPADALPFAIPGLPDQLGCSAKLVARPEIAETLDQKAAKWKGFSFHPMMQGRLMNTVTTATREAGGDPQICCYHWFDYCSGRPLFDGDALVLAELRPGSSWSCPPELVAATLERPDHRIAADLLGRVGELWVEDARMEHASIVAFARTMLELQAFAAPADLLAEVAQAGIDEVEHARLCFGLAARFSGIPREPGKLIPPPVREADLIRLAIDTFVEGCVGETIATLAATRSGRNCTDASVSLVLEQIADDEGRHAALAWRTITWLLDTAGERRGELEQALSEQAAGMAQVAQTEPLPDADPAVRELAALGRLDRRGEQLTRRDAWVELILPTLDACMGRTAATHPRTFA